ncbi:MAG: 30S ribosomal protein S2 [Patescibacteria group bacterium]
MDNTEMKKTTDKEKLDGMFSVGAHFGYQRGRRHPSVRPYLFGSKNRVDIIDLEKSSALLDKAKAFVKKLGATGKVILFVGTKPESRFIVKKTAQSIDMPYVSERWIGGALTNFPEIKKRIEKYHDLAEKKEKGALDVYTKKEKSLIERDMANLNKNFGGLLAMKNIPTAMFVVDSRNEITALNEAIKMNIPTISLSNSDCDVSKIDYPIIGNDSSILSISFFTEEIARAYEEGRTEAKTEVKEEVKTEAKEEEQKTS